MQEVQVAMPVTVILLAPCQKPVMNLMAHVNVRKVSEAGNVMNARQTSMEIPMLNATLVIVILWIPSLSSVITKQENVPVSKVWPFWMLWFFCCISLSKKNKCQISLFQFLVVVAVWKKKRQSGFFSFQIVNNKYGTWLMSFCFSSPADAMTATLFSLFSLSIFMYLFQGINQTHHCDRLLNLRPKKSLIAK